MQAKFRFLISDMSELAQDSTNSLTSIDWDDVVHVETLESVHPQCPICLVKNKERKWSNCSMSCQALLLWILNNG